MNGIIITGMICLTVAFLSWNGWKNNGLHDEVIRLRKEIYRLKHPDD